MQLSQIDIHKTYTIEVPVTSIGQTNFVFPDIPFLRDKVCYGIEATTASYGVNTGKINMFSQPTFTQAGFITLVDSLNDQFVQNMPLLELRTGWYTVFGTLSLPYNTNGLTVFSERVILWNKCTIYFPLTPAPDTARCMQFTIYYK